MNLSLVTYFSSEPLVFVIVASLLSLAVGSFLNVVIYRLPIMLERDWRAECAAAGLTDSGSPEPAEKFNLVVPRSRCPHCDHQIKAWENIPVISFIFLKGKCGNCRKPISPRYPFVETLTAILSGITAAHFGPSLAGLAAILLVWALVALAFIDFDHQILPDVITLPMLWLGLLFNSRELFASLESALFGAVAGYISLWLVYQVFKLVTKKEGMGFGDFKLLALFGAWLGWQQLPLIILLSSFAGAFIGLAMIIILGRDKQLPMPFGPFLCIAGWISLLWGNDIINNYLQLFRVSTFPV